MARRWKRPGWGPLAVLALIVVLLVYWAGSRLHYAIIADHVTHRFGQNIFVFPEESVVSYQQFDSGAGVYVNVHTLLPSMQSYDLERCPKIYVLAENCLYLWLSWQVEGVDVFLNSRKFGLDARPQQKVEGDLVRHFIRDGSFEAARDVYLPLEFEKTPVVHECSSDISGHVTLSCEAGLPGSDPDLPGGGYSVKYKFHKKHLHRWREIRQWVLDFVERSRK